MTLGGRPQEEGGHKPVKVSLNERARSILGQVRESDGNISKFIEEALLVAGNRQLSRLHEIMQQQPLKHTYLNDTRISFTIQPAGSVHYKLELSQPM